MNIVWNSAKEVEFLDAVRNAIGREVSFHYVASSVPCSSCNLDPVNNTSTNSFCPVCSGTYWIPVNAVESVLAHITWGKSDTLSWASAGQYFEGDCRIQIKYTQANLNLINNAKYLTVDGKNMRIENKLFRGVQEINRILLDLSEQE